MYGVEVLVSAETMQRTREQIAYLEVDIVRVKGKHAPVSIYEAITEGQPDASRRSYDAACTRGITAFREQRWDAALAAFAESIVIRPRALLPELYRTRIAMLRDRELPHDWQGVTEFTQK